VSIAPESELVRFRKPDVDRLHRCLPSRCLSRAGHDLLGFAGLSDPNVRGHEHGPKLLVRSSPLAERQASSQTANIGSDWAKNIATLAELVPGICVSATARVGRLVPLLLRTDRTAARSAARVTAPAGFVASTTAILARLTDLGVTRLTGCATRRAFLRPLGANIRNSSPSRRICWGIRVQRGATGCTRVEGR
jgi:hypothetical protein